MGRLKYLSILFYLLAVSVYSQSPADYTFKLLKTEISDTPVSLRFHWLPLSNITTIKIYKKLSTASTYTLFLSLAGTDTAFVDNTISEGVVYDYSFESINSYGNTIARTYTNSSINKPEVNDRGKLLLLIDSTYTQDLATEINRLILDMENDGWTVQRKSIARTMSVPDVKTYIKSCYNSDPTNLKSIFLLGHIPVPYSGNINPDAHTDHQGAWPADGYYADMTGVWTDVSVNNTTASDTRVINVPGDGKYDQSSFPAALSLEIGRVDLYSLPEFTLSDTELIRRYLNKNHAIRTGQISIDRKAVMTDVFGYLGGECPATSGWRAFVSMIPYNDIKTGDYRTLTRENPNGYLLGYGCGPGDYSTVGLVTQTSLFASEAHGAEFNLLFGSYFGDWDSPNNVMRACLASEGNGLTCVWSARPYSILHHMAMGETIGYSMKKSMSNYYNYPTNMYAGLFYRMVHDGLMGDPTLRLHMVSPPTNVSVFSENGLYKLNWNVSSDTLVSGYNLFRHNSTTQKFEKINSELVTTTSFTDSENNLEFPVYMVKAVKTEISNSGSYINQSEGVRVSTLNTGVASINVQESGYVLVDYMHKKLVFNVINGSDNVFATIFSTQGKQIADFKLNEINDSVSYENILEKGIYLVKLQGQKMVNSQKIIIP